MKVLGTKIVNGKKLYLIDEQLIKAETGFSGNFYYVPIQGINSSDNLKTKFTTAKQLTKEQVEQLQNSPTSAKNIAIKEALEKTERLKKSEQAYKKRQETGIQSSQDLADETGAIGDKISLQNIPGIGQYVPDILDVTGAIGSMASGLGRIPLNLEKGNYGQAALSVAMPLGVGALAGVGAENTGQFVNNLANPLAGTGDLINNLGNKYLPNAYKLNPWAFKPNPKAYYRGVGKEGIKDVLETGVIKSRDTDLFPSPYFARPNEFETALYYNPEALIEAKGIDISKVKNIEPNQLIFKNKDAGAVPLNPEYVDEIYLGNVSPGFKQSGLENISTSNPNIRLLQKDWLRGYKEVPKPTSKFKSEIDWSKWNPDTPKYPELINEYNAIEESTKKAGTWMKNPDGSPFKGTPEQFIQQQSSWFKKYFRNSDITGYHGEPQILYNSSFEDFDTFIPSKSTIDNDFYFTNMKDKSLGYGNKTREVYLSDPTIDQNLNPSEYTFGAMNKKAYGYKGKDVNIDIMPGGDEYITKNPYIIKSAVGNVGFFDMTNPNIYKSIVGALATGTLGKQAVEKQEFGGKIKVLDTKIENGKKYFLINK